MDLRRSYDHLVKILLLGDSGVGKSSILLKFIDDTFSVSYLSTIGIDFKVKTIEINDIVIKLQIWDTAGQERYRTITRSYYRDSHGVIFVYDITNIQSFDNISSWMRNLDFYGDGAVEKILVGNKIDIDECRAIHECLAVTLARQNNMDFFEVSAKTGHNINEIFQQLCRNIITNRHLHKPTYGALSSSSSTEPSQDKQKAKRRRMSRIKLKPLRNQINTPADCCKH